MNFTLGLIIGLCLGNASMLVALGIVRQRRIHLGIERAMDLAGC